MAQVEQESAGHGHHGGHRVDVIAHVSGHPTQTFEIGSEATLLHVMERGAKLAGVALLPPRHKPFDLLHAMSGERIGAVIEDLHQTLGEYLRPAGHSAQFTLELVRAFHVNTRWDVAPKEEMSPREILALPRIHLEYTQYTLYLPDSTAELPLDTPIKIVRGTDLEAQADGKYGGDGNMCPERAVEEVKELVARGVPIELTELNGQCYALAKRVAAPAPPWSKAEFDILIAIPAAYDAADLDGFYVELPCGYNNGEHPRVQGQIIEHLDRKWRLVVSGRLKGTSIGA